MLFNITFAIIVLVVINFLLLKFSVNKIAKPLKVNKKPVVLNQDITIKLEEEPLAPTGS